jgi:hypothetical protein
MGNTREKERRFGQSRDDPLGRIITFRERVEERTQLLQERQHLSQE